MKYFRIVLVFFYILTKVTSFLFVPLLEDIYRQYKQTRIPYREDYYVGNKPILKEYDFVVVGTGPGGSVVANRLTEIPEWTTLVLEAGKDSSIYTDIPALVSYLQFTDYNWGFRAEPYEGTCLGMVDQRCSWPRGKGVGGTSLLNYMIYTRGNRRDYDSFAADGNTGWSYDDVIPYFIKSELNNIPEYQNSSFHGKDGYLTVERIPYRTILLDAFLNGGAEIGMENIDYTAPDVYSGFSRIQATMKKGRRMSASRAYLETVKDRCNLHIAEKSRVTRILIDEKTKKAYGVEFVKNRKRRIVLARKEVIISAGALQSPQLLMLSGIGPKAHLEEKNITVLKDLPVGENLHEHWTTPIMIFLVNATNSGISENRINAKTFEQWVNEGSGLLTLAGGVEGVGYVNTKLNPPGEYPDMEFIFAAGGIHSDGGNTIRKGIGITDEIYESVYRCIDYKDAWSIWPMLLRPKGSGKVILRDNNPWHWPLFKYDYLKDPEDMKKMIDAVKQIIELSKTSGFQSVGSTLHSIPIPQCAKLGFGTDEYWDCAIRHMIVTLHHQSGTCKMGPQGDETAVVDPQLKVHGISNLRVVDASIFPRLPSAHLYAPTLMVGEKAADMIKSTWVSSAPNEV